MNKFKELTNGSVSRRAFVRNTALGVAGASLLGGALGCDLFSDDDDSGEPDSIQRILNVTATVEQFGVVVLGAGLESNEQGNFNMPWPDAVVDIVTAARAQEQFHLEFFRSLGGRALVDTFTIPPAALTDYNTFFSAVVTQEAVEIAGQLAAMDVFTTLDRPDLAKVSFQYAAEEAEHRVLANHARGVRPPNDVAFEAMMFDRTEQMLDNMRQRGLIEGTGTPITYPGPGAIDASNVTNRTPDGPPAACSSEVTAG